MSGPVGIWFQSVLSGCPAGRKLPVRYTSQTMSTKSFWTQVQKRYSGSKVMRLPCNSMHGTIWLHIMASCHFHA